MDQEQKTNIDKALAQINKSMGLGTVRFMNDNTIPPIEVISTGSLILDAALGMWGLPRGRVVEIYGGEGAGKTSVALFNIAEAQKQGLAVAFVDAEHALDLNLAKSYGVNIDDLVLNQPDTAEQALDVVEAVVRTGMFGVVVVDSVSALVPEVESEGGMGDQQIGLQARLMSKALRKLTGIVSQTKTTVVFINQLREKVGGYGNPEVTSGGRALKFYASIRIEVKRAEPIKNKDEVIGQVVRVKVVKNKLAVPYKMGTFDLYYGKGIDTPGEIAELAITAGILKRGGAWYSYTGNDGVEQKWQGKAETKIAFANDPLLTTELKERLKTPMVIEQETHPLD